MISSTSNPTVKRLAQLRERRGRAEQGLYLVEGARLVEEALDRALVPATVLVAPALLGATARGRQLYARLHQQRALPAPVETTPGVLRHIADTATPSGVLATLPRRPVAPLTALPTDAGCAVVLDGVSDPGNAGTILRSAAAAGVDAVIALAGCVDLYAPKVVRAAMGAHLRLALAVEAAAADVAAWLPARGQTLLADAQGAESVYAVDLRAPTVVIVGGEAHGAARAATFAAVRRIAIPMPGATESLNVAVATAVILFEAVRQRRASALP